MVKEILTRGPTNTCFSFPRWMAFPTLVHAPRVFGRHTPLYRYRPGRTARERIQIERKSSSKVLALRRSAERRDTRRTSNNIKASRQTAGRSPLDWLAARWHRSAAQHRTGDMRLRLRRCRSEVVALGARRGLRDESRCDDK
jgi:hypothetical protein